MVKIEVLYKPELNPHISYLNNVRDLIDQAKTEDKTFIEVDADSEQFIALKEYLKYSEKVVEWDTVNKATINI